MIIRPHLNMHRVYNRMTIVHQDSDPRCSGRAIGRRVDMEA